ncbi:phosphoribosylglycinamide formyltransferase [Spirochaetota bacterium]|nr:phosphoribosylglycinamide formyltransferase [Spirochaetota bacterium]
MATTGLNTLRLGILISGRGSNMEAIIRHANKRAMFSSVFSRRIEIATVLSDRRDAPGLEIAKEYGIDACYMPPGEFKTKLEGTAEKAYIDYLKQKNVNLICLAGFMRVLKASFLTAFNGRVINIHPSLLPAYPGLNVHKRVLAEKEPKTGCTVHVVSKGIDTGRILEQESLDIETDDTVYRLSQRVLALEHAIYWKVIVKIAAGKDPNYVLPLKD